MRTKGVIVTGHARGPNGRPRDAIDVGAIELVANRPIVAHVLDALRQAGIADVIVVGPAGVLIEVRRALRACKPQAAVEYANCADGPEIGSAVGAAAAMAGDAACVIHLGDGLLGRPLSPFVDAMIGDSTDLTLLVPKPPSSPAVNEAGLRSIAPVEGPSGSSRDRNAGIGLFGPGALKRACAGEPRGPAGDLASVGRWLFDAGGRVEYRWVDGWCRYAGGTGELLELNRLALDEVALDVSPTVARENRIEGRVSVDVTASVRDSVLVGPAIIGAGAAVADAYIGPYTSIGPGARVEGVEIERSIIAAGASVVHVGGRVVSSVVGPYARVFRDFSLPRALRLSVSGGDEVALC